MSLFDAEQPGNAQAPDSTATDPKTTVAPAATAAAPEPAAKGDSPTPADELDLDPETNELDEAEDEIEGVKLKGKKDALERLKAERLMHADYTRKTQTAAEERKALEAERTAHQEQVKVHQALSKEVAKITAIDERLQYLQSINLQALSAQDAQQAQNLLIELNQLQAARGQLITSATQKQQQLQFASQQEAARRANDAKTFLMREFKDWSPEKDAAMEAYARSRGIDSQALGQFLVQHPQIARVIDDGMKYRRSLEQRAAAKPKPAEPPKPVTRIGGAAASNAKPLSQMSAAEHAAWRRERNQKRR